MEINVSWYQVRDMNAAKKFYGEVLGLNKTFEIEGWCEFSHADGAASIGLNQVREKDEERGATVVLRVDDLARAQEELSAKGVRFEGEVQEVPGVVRLATFRDPSGNRLQLCQVLMAQ
jgi:predicted enzyme related to lactoylglutathione lyase